MVRDGVADVLAQRAALDRGAAGGLFVSLLLHAALLGGIVYAAMHATPAQRVGLVNIQFASMPAASTPAPAIAQPKPAAPPPPNIEQPKPKIEQPKPATPEPPKKADKGTVPLDPFGRATKKGSDAPDVAKPKPAPPAPVTPAAPAAGTTTAEVPVGGSGVTGLEGGDFPYTLYINGMQRRIGQNWFRPQTAAGAMTVIYFRIQRDGTITDAKVEQSSGNGTFDRAALSAVRSSTPLNPLPFGYAGTYLGVHLTFR